MLIQVYRTALMISTKLENVLKMKRMGKRNCHNVTFYVMDGQTRIMLSKWTQIYLHNGFCCCIKLFAEWFVLLYGKSIMT